MLWVRVEKSGAWVERGRGEGGARGARAENGAGIWGGGVGLEKAEDQKGKITNCWEHVTKSTY